MRSFGISTVFGAAVTFLMIASLTSEVRAVDFGYQEKDWIDKSLDLIFGKEYTKVELNTSNGLVVNYGRYPDEMRYAFIGGVVALGLAVLVCVLACCRAIFAADDARRYSYA